MGRGSIIICNNTSHYVWLFRANLIRLFIREGYSVVILAPKDKYSCQLEAIGARHIDIPMVMNKNPLSDILLLYRFIKVLKKEIPIAFLGFTIKPNVYGSLAAHYLKIPVINNIAGLGAQFIKNNWTTHLVKFLYRLSLNRSYKVFFQNSDDLRYFLDGNLITHKNYDVLPGSGIDLAKYQYTPLNKPIAGAPMKFLLIARMLWDKGVGEFVDAAKIVKKKYKDVEFFLLGPLDVKNPAAIPRKTVEAWANDGIVNYLGVSQDVRKEIESADCIVLPSYREGTPHTLLEAAAMGRPIITTDVAGCKEVVDDGINGYLCLPKNSKDLASNILKILKLSESQRKIMGINSRKKVERKFDENIVLGKYITVVNQISSMQSYS